MIQKVLEKFWKYIESKRKKGKYIIYYVMEGKKLTAERCLKCSVELFASVFTLNVNCAQMLNVMLTAGCWNRS